MKSCNFLLFFQASFSGDLTIEASKNLKDVLEKDYLTLPFRNSILNFFERYNAFHEIKYSKEFKNIGKISISDAVLLITDNDLVLKDANNNDLILCVYLSLQSKSCADRIGTLEDQILTEIKNEGRKLFLTEILKKINIKNDNSLKSIDNYPGIAVKHIENNDKLLLMMILYSYQAYGGIMLSRSEKQIRNIDIRLNESNPKRSENLLDNFKDIKAHAVNLQRFFLFKSQSPIEKIRSFLLDIQKKHRMNERFKDLLSSLDLIEDYLDLEHQKITASFQKYTQRILFFISLVGLTFSIYFGFFSIKKGFETHTKIFKIITEGNFESYYPYLILFLIALVITFASLGLSLIFLKIFSTRISLIRKNKK